MSIKLPIIAGVQDTPGIEAMIFAIDVRNESQVEVYFHPKRVGRVQYFNDKNLILSKHNFCVCMSFDALRDVLSGTQITVDGYIDEME
nr:hypothetical protein [uncultured Sphaerochaeta sp.]